MRIEVMDRGVIPYGEAWEEQQRYFDDLLGGGRGAGVLMLCEHPHVYTLGKSGKEHNLLVNDAFLRTIGASYYRIDRGGDITYHGPGQLVGYPILNLRRIGDGTVGLKDYVHLLEQAVIDTIADWGIRGGRMDGATGVWIEGERKICAIGVRASKFVTMHGFALNVTTDLNYFNHINPCGFVDKGVTSMAKELRREVEMEEVKKSFVGHFERQFGLEG